MKRNSKAIACCVPTRNRPEELLRFVSSYLDTVNLPTELMIVDDGDPDLPAPFDSVAKAVKARQPTWPRPLLFKTPVSGSGVGYARWTATQYTLKCRAYDLSIHADDDIVLGRGAVESIVAVLRANPSFPYIGSYGCRVLKDCDFNSGSVRLLKQVGSLFGLRHDFLLAEGHFCKELKCLEDLDLGLRVWEAGKYVAAIHAPYEHLNDGGEEDFDTNKALKLIQERHKGVRVCNKSVRWAEPLEPFLEQYKLKGARIVPVRKREER